MEDLVQDDPPPPKILNYLGRCLRKRRVRKDNGVDGAMETVVRKRRARKDNGMDGAMETVVGSSIYSGECVAGGGAVTVTGMSLHVVCEQQEDGCCPAVAMCCLCLLTQAELDSLTIHRKG